MHGFVREFILAVLILLLAGITYLVFSPASRDTKERFWQAQIRSSEHNVALAESLFYAEHGTYTTDLAALAPFDRDTLVAISITRADASGWSGTFALPVDIKRCFAEEPGPPSRSVDERTRGRCTWKR